MIGAFALETQEEWSVLGRLLLAQIAAMAGTHKRMRKERSTARARSVVVHSARFNGTPNKVVIGIILLAVEAAMLHRYHPLVNTQRPSDSQDTSTIRFGE